MTICEMSVATAVATAVDDGRALVEAERLLAEDDLHAPFMAVDAEVVTDRYLRLAVALPDVRLHYTVRTNPAPEVLEGLARLGASFEVTSVDEVDLCLAAGADPSRILFAASIRTKRDVALAWARGVRRFGFDSESELDKLIAAAPGSTACCLVRRGGGADELGSRPGCGVDQARRLIVRAARCGLDVGVSFDAGPGPDQLGNWDRNLAQTAILADSLADAGVVLAAVGFNGLAPFCSYYV